VEENAERLEHFVAKGRADTGAVAAFRDYIGLLRETNAGDRERYAFKLEFPDGRWDVAEQALLSAPRVGDLVWFDGVPWQVLGHRRVPRPHTHTSHEFLACAPVAA
jgi:hypothetical protein